MLNPNPFHVASWLNSSQIQEWIAESRPELAEAISENLPKLIENYSPRSDFGDWYVKFLLSNGVEWAVGINRQQWMFWAGTGIAIRECPYSLQEFVSSLPTPLRGDFRKARLMAEQGLSRDQIYTVLGCRPNTDIENLIAMGAERRSCKSDFRKAVEDHHFPSVVKLLKRFGWRVPD